MNKSLLTKCSILTSLLLLSLCLNLDAQNEGLDHCTDVDPFTFPVNTPCNDVSPQGSQNDQVTSVALSATATPFGNLLGEIKNNATACSGSQGNGNGNGNTGNGTTNCHLYIIGRNTNEVTGFTFDFGNGAGCTGDVDESYARVPDGMGGFDCYNLGTGGSQSTVSIEFQTGNVMDQVELYICKDASSQISLCGLEANGPFNPLPVELSNLAAQLKGEKVALNWSTASEQNNLGFNIEHSTNGRNWETLDFVPGRGTTNETVHYSYEDDQPVIGFNYYRLKQIDYDSRFEYSEIVSVLMDGQKGDLLKVFPNPSSGVFRVSLSNPNKERAFVKLLDSTGSLIWIEQFNRAEAQVYWEKEFDLPQREVYFLVTQVGNQIETQKVVIIDKK